MSDRLEALRAALTTSPRSDAYLRFDQSGWSDSDRNEAYALMLEAAERGDPRIPAALGFIFPQERLDSALGEIFDRSEDAGVKAAALQQMRQRVGQRAASLFSRLLAGEMSDHAAGVVIDTLLETGREEMVRSLLEQTAEPALRVSCVARLWSHHGLDLYPTRSWTGLGLIRAFLEVPMASFQDRVLGEFLAVIGLNPTLAGYSPCLDAMSDPLRTARDAIERGPGALDEGLLAALTDDERDGLLAFAGRRALAYSPGAVTCVGRLGGATHRDLLEWASAQVNPDVAAAGHEALVALHAD